jgi:multiple sugar transport system permease protein
MSAQSDLFKRRAALRPIPWYRQLKAQQRISDLLTYVVLIVLCLMALFPVLWMVSLSFKELSHMFDYPPRLIPDPWSTEGYRSAIEDWQFVRYFGNTVFITGLRMIGTLLASSLVAYGFARYDGPLKEVMFIVVLSPLFLPEQITLIPLFIGYSKLNWIDTYYPLVVPAFFGKAVYIFLLRQFFMTLPTELDDAARLDGCSEFGILWRIILPLSKPALAAVAIFTFMDSWNDFLIPLIFLKSTDKLTLSVGLTRLLGEAGTTQWHTLMASATLMVVPPILLFILFQRYFIQGIALTGMKG